MIRITILIAFLGAFAAAGAVEPPASCYYGAVYEANGSVDGEECAGLSCEDYDYNFSFDYLDASISQHVLVNQPVRVKGDGEFGFSANDTIRFYDSINGYVGSDTSNTEGNAYITYQIGTSANRGHAWVWVTKKNGSWCSKEDTYLQNPPELNVDYTTTRNYRSDGTYGSTFVQLVADVYIDQYSKVGVRNTNYSIKWYVRHSLAVDWNLVATNVDTYSNTYASGVTYFKVVLNDGKFTDTSQFYITTAIPAADADPCIAKPWLPQCEP